MSEQHRATRRRAYSQPRHRHTWQATLYDGKWVEYCASLCGVPYRRARLRPSGAPVALARYHEIKP